MLVKREVFKSFSIKLYPGQVNNFFLLPSQSLCSLICFQQFLQVISHKCHFYNSFNFPLLVSLPKWNWIQDECWGESWWTCVCARNDVFPKEERGPLCKLQRSHQHVVIMYSAKEGPSIKTYRWLLHGNQDNGRRAGARSEIIVRSYLHVHTKELLNIRTNDMTMSFNNKTRFNEIAPRKECIFYILSKKFLSRNKRKTVSERFGWWIYETNNFDNKNHVITFIKLSACNETNRVS